MFWRESNFLIGSKKFLSAKIVTLYTDEIKLYCNCGLADIALIHLSNLTKLMKSLFAGHKISNCLCKIKKMQFPLHLGQQTAFKY